MRSMKKTVFIAMGIALAFSGLLAGGMAFWDWLENPSGIFRAEGETNWAFVRETFFSWFWPTLGRTVPVGIVIGLACSWFCGRRSGD